MGAGVGLAEWGGASAAWAGSPRPSDIVTMDAVELSSAIRRRRVSCREVMDAFLDHIERVNPRVNAIVSMADRDVLLRQASRRDAQLRRGRVLGWMHGFPTRSRISPTRRGSSPRAAPRFPGFGRRGGRPLQGAHQGGRADRDRQDELPEFGLGSQTYPVFGTTLNAYDQSRTAGGSSGGAAVALALRWCRGRRERLRRLASQPGGLQQRARLPDLLRADTRPRRRPLDRPARGRRPDGPQHGRGDAALDDGGSDPGLPYSIEQDPERFTARLKRDFRGTRIAVTGTGTVTCPWSAGCSWSAGAPPGLRGHRLPGRRGRARLPPPGRSGSRFAPVAALAQRRRPGKPADDPAKRALMKPEAIFEVEGFLRLSARDVHRASAARSNWYRAVLGLFQIRLPRAPQRPGVSLRRGSDLAEGDCGTADGHLPPVDGGGHARDALGLPCHQRARRLHAGDFHGDADHRPNAR